MHPCLIASELIEELVVFLVFLVPPPDHWILWLFPVAQMSVVVPLVELVVVKTLVAEVSLVFVVYCHVKIHHPQ